MRKYNFHAGPATLPEALLLKAQAELLDWEGRGLSVVEISHRAQPFMELVERSIEKLRHLLKVPNNYRIIYVAAPARAQYAMIPMNILGSKTSADYLETGYWSSLAQQEAEKYCDAQIACTSKPENFTTIPDPSTWQLNPNAAFCHYTTNETIHGVQFHSVPEVGDVPLTADMTSDFLSYPMDIKRFGIIFAGTQKNVAPAGMTIVIVREDLLGHELPITPSCWSYSKHVAESSLLYTSVSFSCYMAELMFDWIKEQGGLSSIASHNKRRAKQVYSVIDSSNFYINKIDPRYRSMTNIPFQLDDEVKTALFLQEAEQNDLIGLKGHRLVGGIRASLYNAQTDQAVSVLTEFMQDFAKRYG